MSHNLRKKRLIFQLQVATVCKEHRGKKPIILLLSWIFPMDSQFKQKYPIVPEGLAFGGYLDTRKAMNASGTSSRQDHEVGEVQVSSWESCTLQHHQKLRTLHEKKFFKNKMILLTWCSLPRCSLVFCRSFPCWFLKKVFFSPSSFLPLHSLLSV